MLIDIVSTLHKSTKRDYIGRVMDDKPHCMEVAKRYGLDYWDGDRRYGYGGYKYIPDRWKPPAQALIDRYKLRGRCRILDIGCGKGYQLYELKRLLPDAEVIGCDISGYAITHCHPALRDNIMFGKAQARYHFDDDHFDLVMSNGCLHNLEPADLKIAIREIERIGQNKYINVESWRNDHEQHNMMMWALTAQAFYSKRAWEEDILKAEGYTGDWEFIYFE